MSSRNILIAIIVIVVIVILGVGLYFLFTSKPATTTIGQTGSLPATGDQQDSASQNGNSTSTQGAEVTTIFTTPILDYFVSSSSNAVAIQADGEIVAINNGQATVLSSLKIQNIINVGFSHDGAKALVTFGDPTDPQTSVFDLASKTWTPMAQGWESPVWSPVDYRIAYLAANAGGTETVATFDASKPKNAAAALVTLHAEDLSLAWPDKNDLILSTKPSAYVAGSSWSFNLPSKTLTNIAMGVQGLDIGWSESALTAQTGLALSDGSNGDGGTLQLITLAGTPFQSLSFLTLPSKCAFGAQTSTIVTPASSSLTSATSQTTSTAYLYCGVPQDQNDLSISHLPDDYDQMAFFTSDNIYQINLGDGTITTLFNNSSQNFDTSDVKIFNGAFFFINRYNQYLYSITL